ncbi:MAG: hypothetical protein EZS28_034122, partial [Streblomastix strix]
MSASTQTNNI